MVAPLVDEALQFTLSPDDRELKLYYSQPSPHGTRRFHTSFYVILTIRLARDITGRHICPESVRIAYPPPLDHIRAKITRWMGAPIQYGSADNAFVFSENWQDIPLPGYDSYLNELLLKLADTRYADLRAARPTIGAVRSVLASLLRHGETTADEIARHLGLSSRTLHRRLANERTTFAKIREDIRRELAERYVAREELSIGEIAHLLGFQEASAFTHAHKRWFGVTPREARARARASRSVGPVTLL